MDFFLSMIIYAAGAVFGWSMSRQSKPPAPKPTTSLVLEICDEQGEPRSLLVLENPEDLIGEVMLFLETDGYEILERERKKLREGKE